MNFISILLFNLNKYQKIIRNIFNLLLIKYKLFFEFNMFNILKKWGLGIGDWGLGIGPNPQSPIPNPQSPIPNPHY